MSPATDASVAPTGPTRPRDASSLVLVRRDRRGRAEFLLGCRGHSDSFMPGWYVFPGGGVEAGDRRHPCHSELRPDVAQALEVHASSAAARAMAVAAIRETFEETGVLVGGAGAAVGSARVEEIRPDLERLDYFARAITPTMSRTRFHARFFLTEASEELASTPLAGDGELHDLGWFSEAASRPLEMVGVTRFVLEEAQRVLAGERHGVPLYRYRGITGRAVYP